MEFDVIVAHKKTGVKQTLDVVSTLHPADIAAEIARVNPHLLVLSVQRRDQPGPVHSFGVAEEPQPPESVEPEAETPS